MYGSRTYPSKGKAESERVECAELTEYRLICLIPTGGKVGGG